MWFINLLFRNKTKIKKEQLRNRTMRIVSKDSLTAKTTEIVRRDKEELKEDKPVIKAIKKIVAHIVKVYKLNGEKFKNIRKIQIKGEDCNDGNNGK